VPFDPERLRRLREAHVPKLSRAALAELAGTSPQYISHLENGIKTNPAADLLERLAKGLGCHVTELFDGPPEFDTLAELVKTRREQLLISRPVLAALLGIDQKEVVRIERGRQEKIDAALALRLAAVLMTPLGQVIPHVADAPGAVAPEKMLLPDYGDVPRRLTLPAGRPDKKTIVPYEFYSDDRFVAHAGSGAAPRDGVLAGDKLVFQKCKYAPPNHIAAIIAGGWFRLKHTRYEDCDPPVESNGKLVWGRNLLVPAGPDDDEVLYQSAVEVLGVLVGLVRHVEHHPYVFHEETEFFGRD
jgi:transcriptional regulator with XRE-family HTH domain